MPSHREAVSLSDNLLAGGPCLLALLDYELRAETSHTVTSADYGKALMFSAEDNVAVTLPANSAPSGSWFACLNVGSDSTNPTYSAATADSLIAFNDDAADSVSFASGQRIGSAVMFISNGTYWVALNINGACAMTVNS